MRATERQESTSLDPSVSRQRCWRGLRRIQIEIAVLAIVLAMGVDAVRLGPIRGTLIKHHDEAADDLERVAAWLDASLIDRLIDRPIEPDSDRRESPSVKDRERARAYRRLARWYRWQAWRYRLPLFTSVSRYKGLDPQEIDTREWIKKLGYLERIERQLSAEESSPHL